MAEIKIEVNPISPSLSVQSGNSILFALTNVSHSITVLNNLAQISVNNVPTPVIEVPVYNSFFSFNQNTIQISATTLGAQGLKGDKGDTGEPGLGDMNKSVYDNNNDGVVNAADYANLNGGYF